MPITAPMLILLWVLVVVIFVTPLLLRRYRRGRRASEREKLAASRGWRFAASDETVLTRWRGDPFDRRGDKRQAFGVVRGVVSGVAFTAFDYRRRTTAVRNAPDEYETVTVWAMRLPGPLPGVRMLRQRPVGGLRGKVLEKLDARVVSLPTGDEDFDRHFTVTSRQPEFVKELFTPELIGWLREHKIQNWRIEGQDLLHYRDGQLRRTKPTELEVTAERLAELITRFPASVWQRYGRPDVSVP
jgi:hypothetical protein